MAPPVGAPAGDPGPARLPGHSSILSAGTYPPPEFHRGYFDLAAGRPNIRTRGRAAQMGGHDG
ncbi:hypothetical protein L838_1307 [Mycobacterium avium MAV_120709_2344]|nr:hypothetical protein L838_1307 [Mycobacterium avium MAV_120709_2344]ETZ56105.1 hypothetical protein L840_3864 [Mycobacterium sp. MAC_011194_8550]ETZ68251.1 hypothetical protein L841_2374 [Mycobacterium sp. MAC_080597_8934]